MPQFCPNATWNATATTFADNTIVGTNPWSVFVNTNNTIYVVNQQKNWIRVWSPGSSVPTGNISGSFNTPYSFYITDNSDIYIDNGQNNKRIDKLLANSTLSVPAMYMCGACYGVFVDINNNLYCSMYDSHQVVAKSLNNRLNVWSVVAGTGTLGSASNMLYYPRGIYVDSNLNLYVSDYYNDRIQMFPYGQLNGTAVVGDSAPGTISIDGPTALTMDANGYLFISDTWHHRIIGGGPYGYRCIASCSGGGGLATQLSFPAGLSFDSYGNLYVADWGNSRIQMFFLTQNTCGKIILYIILF